MHGIIIRREEALNKHSLVDRLGPSIDWSLLGTYPILYMKTHCLCVRVVGLDLLLLRGS